MVALGFEPRHLTPKLTPYILINVLMLTKVTTSPSNLFHRVRLKETDSVLLGGSSSIRIGMVVFQPFVLRFWSLFLSGLL